MANIRVTCPTCQSELEIGDEFVGQEVECGSCLQVFVAQPQSRGRSRTRDGQEPREDRPRRRKRPRPRDDDDDYDFDRHDDYDDDDYYDSPRRRGGGNGLATASLVMGILGLFPGCCCILLGGPLSVAAIVTGAVSLNDPDNKGMATAGIVLGVVGLAFDVLALALNLGVNNGNRF